MQLYFSPFACSLASHITLREAGLDAELTAVSISTKQTAKGEDYLAIAPKGQVPALRLDDGSLLTESAAVLQYLADLNPAAGLMPAGGRERYEVLQWLSYIGTEIHKSCFALMFNPTSPPEAKAWGRGLLDGKLAHVAAELGDRTYLVGGKFTIVDAYLTWVLNLAGLVGVTLPAALERYLGGMKARPAVQAALAAEGAAAAAAAGRN